MAKETRFFVRVSETQKARIVKAAVGKKSVAAFLLSSVELRMRWGGVIRAIEQAESRGFKKSTIAQAVLKGLAQI